MWVYWPQRPRFSKTIDNIWASTCQLHTQESRWPHQPHPWGDQVCHQDQMQSSTIPYPGADQSIETTTPSPPWWMNSSLFNLSPRSHRGARSLSTTVLWLWIWHHFLKNKPLCCWLQTLAYVWLGFDARRQTDPFGPETKGCNSDTAQWKTHTGQG